MLDGVGDLALDVHECEVVEQLDRPDHGPWDARLVRDRPDEVAGS
jgi:hypothetical protein